MALLDTDTVNGRLFENEDPSTICEQTTLDRELFIRNLRRHRLHVKSHRPSGLTEADEMWYEMIIRAVQKGASVEELADLGESNWRFKSKNVKPDLFILER